MTNNMDLQGRRKQLLMVDLNNLTFATFFKETTIYTNRPSYLDGLTQLTDDVRRLIYYPNL